MRQFTKLVENLESNKFYKIETTLDLVLKAENAKEAGMLAEQILKNVDNHYDYNTKQIQEVTKNEYNHLVVSEKISLTGDKILNSWNKTFGDENPSLLEKMEFYHLMRSRGFEAHTIESALDGKI
jgi:hypothetical protein